MSENSPLDREGLIRVGIQTALEQARKSYSEGGVPIGGALVINSSHKILGAGHNQRIQKSSPILHGETAALEDAGRLPADVYRQATMVCATSYCKCIFSGDTFHSSRH
jgi:creatinine deaminase